MPSLSGYDKGKKSMEGRRYVADIKAGNDAFGLLTAPLDELNGRRRAQKGALWQPDLHLLRGNHEDRANRAAEQDAQLDGLVTCDDMLSPGWRVHPFLQILDLDGVWYSHYLYQPMTGRPYAGTIDNRLKSVGHSFTMGHQQTLLHGVRYVGAQQQHGLVAGACYLHDEDYKGPQGNAHWRGIIVCHEVEGGAYDPMFVSLDYLCRRFEGVRLAQFTARRF